MGTRIWVPRETLAEAAGARLYENSPALSVEKHGAVWSVRTAQGEVRAPNVVYCVSSLDRTLHGVDAMTSILRSAAEGRFIDLATTCTQPAALGIEEAKALLR